MSSGSIGLHASSQICATLTAERRSLGGGTDSPAPQRNTRESLSIAARSLLLNSLLSTTASQLQPTRTRYRRGVLQLLRSCCGWPRVSPAPFPDIVVHAR